VLRIRPRKRQLYVPPTIREAQTRFSTRIVVLQIAVCQFSFRILDMVTGEVVAYTVA
jgi:uncharacterized membrane protein